MSFDIRAAIKSVTEKVVCPLKQDTQCSVDLAACKEQLVKASATSTGLRMSLAEATVALATTTANLQSCNIDLDIAKNNLALFLNGPAAPTKDNLRIISASSCQQLLAVRLGQPFLDALSRNQIHFAWPPWLVCKQDDVLRYLDFYNTQLLAYIQPYVVLNWQDAHGNKLQISGRTCSDFSAFFWGLPTLYLSWTPLCWGIMWGNVQSIFLNGGHAFNWIVVWKDGYTEMDGDITGLDLLEIEPQTSGHWTAGGVALDATARVERLELKPITPARFDPAQGGYQIDQIWNVTA
jgi:hypothetical protein